MSTVSSSLTGDLLPALQLQVDPAQVAHHARRRLDPLASLQGGFTATITLLKKSIKSAVQGGPTGCPLHFVDIESCILV